MQTGRVKWFDEKKGYGFIIPDDGGHDVFVHHSQAPRGLFKDDVVEYDEGPGRKGPQAENVKILRKATAE